MEAKVCELINEIACLDELNTIIVVTHDVTAAATVADHLWVMGRDRDGDGNVIPGARIQETYDLIHFANKLQESCRVRELRVPAKVALDRTIPQALMYSRCLQP